jgi:pimeloyl-ACP methyl ester carboxylesterase
MEDLPRIKQRSLILCGAEDKMTPVKYSQFLKEALPHAQLHVIENAGHLVIAEQPEKVAELLKAFVESLPVRTRKPGAKKTAAAENAEVIEAPAKSE